MEGKIIIGVGVTTFLFMFLFFYNRTNNIS